MSEVGLMGVSGEGPRMHHGQAGSVDALGRLDDQFFEQVKLPL